MRRGTCVATLLRPLLLPLLVGSCRMAESKGQKRLPDDRLLSPEGARHASHVVSPDGARVAYWAPVTDSTGGWQLWVANADLREAQALPVTALAPSAPVWRGDSQQLATISSQFSASDVVVVTLATNAVQRVTMGKGTEVPLAWSADGQSLSLQIDSDAGVITSVILDVPSGSALPLIPGESRPVFGVPSPDGRYRAYTLVDGARSTVWLADSAGLHARPLTTEGYELMLDGKGWSPDSRSLLFTSTRTGTRDLWVASVDSVAPRQLTRNVRHDWDGAWSPDGQFIAFLSDRGRQTDIWVVPAAGGEERRITNSVAEEQSPLQWRGPDHLTFRVRSDHSAIWALDLASGTERQLTPDSLPIGDFWMSPVGAQLSVVVERGGGVNELALLSLDAGPMRSLVTSDARIGRPLFSPDGTQLAYTSDQLGSPDIWVMDVAGGAPRALVSWPGFETDAVWSADGRSLVFYSDRDALWGDMWQVPATGGTPERVTRDGRLQAVVARAGFDGIYATHTSPGNGVNGLLRLGTNGTLVPVWNRSNVTHVRPLTADSVIAMVEQPDGSPRATLLPVAGGKGRVLLNAGETARWPSYDKQWLSFEIPSQGASDLGIVNLVSGERRRLMQTPDDESGAEFTPDGKSLVFLRSQRENRIHEVRLMDLLRKVGRPGR